MKTQIKYFDQAADSFNSYNKSPWMGKYCLRKKIFSELCIYLKSIRDPNWPLFLSILFRWFFFFILSNYKYLIFSREMIPIVDIDYLVSHWDKILQYKIAGPKNKFLLLYLEII